LIFALFLLHKVKFEKIRKNCLYIIIYKSLYMFIYVFIFYIYIYIYILYIIYLCLYIYLHIYSIYYIYIYIICLYIFIYIYIYSFMKNLFIGNRCLKSFQNYSGPWSWQLCQDQDNWKLFLLSFLLGKLLSRLWDILKVQ